MEGDGPRLRDTESNRRGGGFSTSTKRGNWITTPFILATFSGLTLAVGGWQSNLIVYLIEKFNVKSIDAAQINNIVNGCSNLFPVAGAVLADSFLGSFLVVLLSASLSLLGVALLVLTALSSSKKHFALLYTAITLASIGSGGSRFTTATFGANQFDSAKDKSTFFNWYFVTMYVFTVVSGTVIVYVEDNVGWTFGFAICFAANLVGLVILLSGCRFYVYDKPQGSPFTGLVRVCVAAVRKRKVALSSSRIHDYYHESYGMNEEEPPLPGKTFRFLNRAALVIEGDIKSDGITIAKPWRLCTVEQVENLKTLIRIFPLWSSSIFLGTPIAIQASLTILQALAMDRHMGQHFKIPAGSMLVVTFISTSIFLTFIDQLSGHVWRKLTGKSPTPLQRIGVGHVLNVLSMAVSAIVESKRLKAAHQDMAEPMSVLWLFPQLILVGIGEAFHFPGQVALYYQEFPVALRSTGTAMISLLIGIAYYLSSALIDLLRRAANWLPDDINNGRLDNVYWMMVVVGVINFGYYIGCAKLYKYQNVQKATASGSSSGSEN